MRYTGSCLCGEVTYEVDGDFENFYLCHCTRCQKDTGSAHAANLFSSTAQFKWLSGEERVRTFDFRSEGHIKSFCSICGSALPNLQLGGKLLVVPAGSLDQEVSIGPQGHIYYESRANWDEEMEKIPRYPELPST